jgi:hypothetical protein
LSIAAKTKMVVAGLAALTLWPLVHLAICARWDASPWKLAGWGMYATPRPRTLGMEVYGGSPGGGAFVQLTAPTPPLRVEGAAFLERWRWLGGLAHPDAFARLVFETRPDWSRLRIELYRSHLDAATGMVSLRRDDRYYERAAGDGAARVAVGF